MNDLFNLWWAEGYFVLIRFDFNKSVVQLAREADCERIKDKFKNEPIKENSDG